VHAGKRTTPSRASEGDAKPLILIVDRDLRVRRRIGAALARNGYALREAQTGRDGLTAAAHGRPDLIVLGLDLPDRDGGEVLKTIRSWSNVPVIAISAERGERHKVRVLKLGADDYVVKPFGIAELAARCEAALRRYHRAADRGDPVVRTGALTIDLVSRAVTRGGTHVKLTRNEYRLLHVLATHLGLVVTHGLLIREVWGHSSLENVQYVRMLVRKLRQKLEVDPGAPRLLISESGVGYRLERRAASAPAIPEGG
jgi:two-component system, OmpR family, KDP operon response regulator KdpE